MKKLLILLLITALNISTINFGGPGEKDRDIAKAEEAKQVDEAKKKATDDAAKKSIEEARQRADEAQKTKELLDQLLADSKKQVTLTQQQATELAQKIDRTYTTARLENSNNIKNLFDGLDQLSQQLSKYPRLQQTIREKINALTNAVIIKIETSPEYVSQLNSAAISILFKNLTKMQDREATVIDAIKTLVEHIPTNILLDALVYQNWPMKIQVFKTIIKQDPNFIGTLNDQALTALLKTTIEIGSYKKSGIDLIDEYIKIVTNAAPDSLRNALEDDTIGKGLTRILKALTDQQIPEYSKSQQIKDLFIATQRIVPSNEILTNTLRDMLEKINDFSVFETQEERTAVIETLKEIARQTATMKSGNKEERQANIINMIDRFVTALPLNTDTAQFFNEFAALLKTISSERAAVTERAVILHLLGNKGFEQTIQTTLANYLNRKEITLDLKLSFLIEARTTAAQKNSVLTKIIDNLLLRGLSLITSPADIPEGLFTLLSNENLYKPEVVFDRLMRSEIWENPTAMTKIQDKIMPLLTDVTDTATLAKILDSKTTKEIKNAAMDKLLQKSPEEIQGTSQIIDSLSIVHDLKNQIKDANIKAELTNKQLAILNNLIAQDFEEMSQEEVSKINAFIETITSDIHLMNRKPINAAFDITVLTLGRIIAATKMRSEELEYQKKHPWLYSLQNTFWSFLAKSFDYSKLDKTVNTTTALKYANEVSEYINELSKSTLMPDKPYEEIKKEHEMYVNILKNITTLKEKLSKLK